MTPRDLKLEGTEPFTEADRRWQRRAEELRLAALPALRASAERWAGSVTAILGAVSLAALLEGPDKLNALAGCWEVIGKAALFLAVVAGLASLWNAAITARSTRLKTFLPTGPELKRASDEAVRDGLRKMAWSQGWAVVAVALALVSAFCLWWGERDPRPLPEIVLPATACEEEASVEASGDGFVLSCGP